MQDLHDLVALIKSQTSLITIENKDEALVVDLVKQAASRTRIPFYTWSVTQGVHPKENVYTSEAFNKKPDEVLNYISSGAYGIFLLLDFHPYFEKPERVRLFKEIIQDAYDRKQRIILLSHQLTLPPEIKPFAVPYQLELPSKKKLKAVVKEELHAWGKTHGKLPIVKLDAIKAVINNLQGLQISDVRQLVRVIVNDDGAVTNSDLPVLIEKKVAALNRDGILSLELETTKFSDIGGLKMFKSWLKKRSAVFNGEVKIKGLPFPKGVMLLGVQGCGKSLAAKMVSGMWGAPLLRLDMGAVYNKYYGETEKNIRESLEAADALSPCVLWIDEIEKGISSNGDDNGPSQRVLATLLTWMAERKSSVFIVATANDIESLPPELIRKGRLDEIFFVDLPDAETRNEILSIHLEKRELAPEDFDLTVLVSASEGFSGSEIEQAVVSGLYSALGNAGQLTSQILLAELKATRPLSVLMAEKIDKLRRWASKRTVPAN